MGALKQCAARPKPLGVLQITGHLSRRTGKVQHFFGAHRRMRELVRSNDPILLSFLTVLLRDAGIHAAVWDTGMSALEGSIGALPRRLAVAEEDYAKARRVLEEAGLAGWAEDDGRG